MGASLTTYLLTYLLTYSSGREYIESMCHHSNLRHNELDQLLISWTDLDLSGLFNVDSFGTSRKSVRE